MAASGQKNYAFDVTFTSALGQAFAGDPALEEGTAWALGQLRHERKTAPDRMLDERQRRLLLDLVAARNPRWTERNPADTGIALKILHHVQQSRPELPVIVLDHVIPAADAAKGYVSASFTASESLNASATSGASRTIFVPAA